MGLKINMQFAMLGIHRTDALISIENRLPEMEIESKLTRADIDIEYPKVSIDQKDCLSEIGQKPLDRFAKSIAQRSQAEGQKAIVHIAQKGDTLARVDKNPGAISYMAKKEAQDKRDHNIDAVPKSRPRISFEGGIEVNWRTGDVKIEVSGKKPRILATRGKIEVYLIKKPQIDMEYTRRTVDRTI